MNPRLLITVSSVVLLGSVAFGALEPDAAEPTVVDPMDNADNFFHVGEHALVGTEDGVVTLGKADPNTDAFVRWAIPRSTPVPIEEGPRIEIDIAELRGGAELEVRVQFVGEANADLGYHLWEERVGNPGTIVLEDLNVFADKNEVAGPEAVRLLLRHKGNPNGIVVIDEIRFLPVADN
ncbi:MAG: hypothetical protein AAF743_15970 [Planctomycetota bacterium]